MPNFDYICERGHAFERNVPAEQFDYAQQCECGAIAKQVWLTAPGFAVATPAAEERIYREHNVTRTEHLKFDDDTFVTKRPIAASEGCQCGNCRAHVKRAGVTAVAEPGKER